MIISDNPQVIPATEEKVFNQVWMKELHLRSRSAEQEVNANVVLQMYSGSGETIEVSPAQPINFQIKDIFSQAEYDAEQVEVLVQLLGTASRAQKIGLIATALLGFVEEEAKSQELI